MRDVFHLEQVGTYVPPTRVSVGDLQGPLSLTDTQVAYFTRYLGLDRIAVADGIDLAEMLTAAGEDALRGVDRSSIRFLIHAHTMQHVASPARDLLEDVRAALRLDGASVLGTSHLNCVSGLYALQVARYLLAGEPAGSRALVLTGDKMISHRARLMPELTIMGEAAAGCVVGPDPRGDRLLSRSFRVNGRFYQGLDWSGALRSEYKNMYAENLREVMRGAVLESGHRPADVDLVIPHNVNRLTWKGMVRTLGIPMDRVYLDNVPKYGHCWTSDAFLNIAALRSENRLREGDLVLVAAAGLGATFAASTVRIGAGIRSEALVGAS